MKRTAGVEIERLIQLWRLPGLGPRSARRAALYLIKNRENFWPSSTAPIDAGQGHSLQ
jgi:recombination protein RecR